jgi:fatty-acyl-CoA synthase
MGDKTLGELIDDVGTKYCEKVALYIDQEGITFHEVKKSSNNLAKGLLNIGITKGDRVCIWMGNRLEWVYCFFALSKIGAIVVPINTRLKAEEAGNIIEQVEPTTLIVNDIFLNINFMDMVYELIPEARLASPEKARSGRYPSLKNIICFSTSGKRYAGTYNFAELDHGDHRIQDRELTEIQKNVNPEDAVLIQFTSGTTGFPKGAILTHRNFTKLGYYVGLRQELKETDRFFSTAPYFHCAGTLHAITAPFSFGCTVYSLKRYEIEKALETIWTNKCNVYHGFNIYRDIVGMKDDLTKKYDISCIERAWMTGSSIELRMINDLGIKGICHIYGLTETTGNATLCSPHDPLDLRINTVGKPHPGVEICIKDKDGKRGILPPNQEGEICVRGWNVMKGYHNNPEETRKALDEEMWLHSGDLGSLDNSGNLLFLGRMKDIIRVGGENFSPTEVEDFLKRNPKVIEACVVGVPDRRLDQVGMALIKLKDGEKATEQEFIDFCKNKIANFKIPRYVRFVEEFPMTETNKIKRYEVKEMAMKELS